MNFSASLPSARTSVQDLGASRIREVANVGLGRTDVLPFWFGEPDQVTPDFIRAAAKAALDAGDTFYTHNCGLPALRAALATYLSGLHARRIDAERIAVTSSGVSALMLLSQLIVHPGDRVVAVTPLWPNLFEIPKILGAEVIQVPLQFGATWELDVDQLLAQLIPGTRAVYINSPNNPTGWVITREQQQRILAHCREHGIWIAADDVYERLVFGAVADHGDQNSAPSFLDLAEPHDRVVCANSFSKSWLMTGWRLGWVVAPASMMADLGKLIEYNTSCAPGFIQQAAIVAIEQGEPVIAATVARYREARDYLHAQLNRIPGISAPLPGGAMYLFFKLDGCNDSLSLCKQLVREAGLGLAPGSAFGPQGEGYVRWCFAASTERLADGVHRLERFLNAG